MNNPLLVFLTLGTCLGLGLGLVSCAPTNHIPLTPPSPIPQDYTSYVADPYNPNNTESHLGKTTGPVDLVLNIKDSLINFKALGNNKTIGFTRVILPKNDHDLMVGNYYVTPTEDPHVLVFSSGFRNLTLQESDNNSALPAPQQVLIPSLAFTYLTLHTSPGTSLIVTKE